ncbi:hypothetical protein BSU04_14635 [Caballeronia sordidicola]|uniref:Uncharacterized protein n=1 Tax=Caballeronia sordidicola TaxID=196367 RepID=A0A226X4J5_CABSO|nr:hypothetical protein BSU04_14635 [Caballeronia sordidicola]
MRPCLIPWREHGKMGNDYEYDRDAARNFNSLFSVCSAVYFYH